MRKIPRLLIALPLLAAGSNAAAQKIGERTGVPEELFSGIGEGTGDAELEQAIAAAAAHPLGSLANPVRVGGPEGARAYLGRLRCADGSVPKVGEQADGGVGAFGTVTLLYRLDCGRAAPGTAAVTVDIYHEEHRETQAPPGWSIAR